MTFEILSILGLILAIVLAFVFNCNTGLLAIMLAYIIGKAAGMSDSAIFAGFPSSLFLLIFGVMFLFAIAQENQSLSLLVKKILRKTGRQAWLIPIVMYIIFLAITSLGAGPYAVLALNALVAIPLAKELKANPIFLLMSGGMGISAGTCSPISLGGMVFTGLLPEIGYDASIVTSAFINIMICETIMFAVMYILFRGWKLRPAGEGEAALEDLPKFNQKQIITLIGILVFIVAVSLFGLNPGGVGVIVGMVLIFLKAGDEKTVIRSIPWGTIIMLCGVSLIINVMQATGGVDLIANALTSIVGPGTAVPFMSFASGIFSLFAVMSSVVIPTLTPMLPAIILAVGGGTGTMVQLVAGILFCGYATAVSPLSSGGGVYMAAIASMDDTDKGGVNMKLFTTFFVIAGIQLVVGVLFAFLGMFGIVS